MLKARSLCFATAVALGIVGYLVTTRTDLNAQQGAQVKIKADDIGGVVSSSKGPEAGVWVIAETTDLPTRYIKEVVTDDRGRYLIPDLPKAKYSVWARGYGLVDSPKAQAEPGKQVDLKPTIAPDAKAAAHSWAEAATHPLCLLTPDMQNRRILDKHFREAGAKVQATVETNSLITLWSHLRFGDLATVVPHTFLLLLDRMDEFAAIPLVEPEASHAVGLVASERDPLPPVTRAFLDFANMANLKREIGRRFVQLGLAGKPFAS